MKPVSLRVRIFIIAVAAYLIAAAFSAVMSNVGINESYRETIAAELESDTEQLANMLDLLTSKEFNQTITDAIDYARSSGQSGLLASPIGATIGRSILIADNSGQILLKTDNAPEAAPPYQAGFYYHPDNDNGHALYLRHYDVVAGLWIIAAQNRQLARTDLFTRLLDLYIPPLLSCFIAALVIFFLLRWAMGPLDRLNRTQALDTGNKLALEDAPVEVHALVTAINRFFNDFEKTLTEQQHILEREKRFTANAAHELMTPLAAIRSEVQFQQKQADDDASRSVFEEIISRVDRATHTVDQLISLARLDPEEDKRQKVQRI